MKGRYGGRMTIYGSILPRAALVARLAVAPPAARRRLKVLDWHQAHGHNLSLTARRFGLQRLTIRRWVKKARLGGIMGLADRSHRPKHLRVMTTPWETVGAVVRCRKQYPAWSKYKIASVLKRQGVSISDSSVGRILKRRGLIDRRVSHKKRRASKHPKLRFPKGLKIHAPGDMLQLDTKYVLIPGGYKFYQFTAIDVLTKLRVLRVYSSQSSRNGRHFLQTCLKTFSFPIKAVQTDNGAPFLKEFDAFCHYLKLPHYFTYPRTPKQNSYVEISHGADEREFYQQGNVAASYQDYAVMCQRVLAWEQTWNTVRPHQALNYLTPAEYLQKWQTGRLPTKDIITLQT